MLLRTRQVQFILKGKTQAYVSKLLNIPKSTLSYVSRGLRELPEKFTGISNLGFLNDADDRMNTVGFAEHQVDRFLSYSPESVWDALVKTEDRIGDYTGGLYTSKLAGIEFELSTDALATLWNDCEDKIREGFRNTKQPLENSWEGS